MKVIIFDFRQHLEAINCLLDPMLDVPEGCDRQQLRIFLILESMLWYDLGVGAYIDLTLLYLIFSLTY